MSREFRRQGSLQPALNIISENDEEERKNKEASVSSGQVPAASNQLMGAAVPGQYPRETRSTNLAGVRGEMQECDQSQE